MHPDCVETWQCAHVARPDEPGFPRGSVMSGDRTPARLPYGHRRHPRGLGGGWILNRGTTRIAPGGHRVFEWTLNGARLAVAAPWLVLLFMSLQSEVIRRYSSPAGIAVLAVGAGLCLVAYRLMMRIGRLPVERRILS